MPHCLSTIESIHRVLEILEPKLDAENLLHVFRQMVKRQLDYAEREQIRITESTSRRGKKVHPPLDLR
jgi:DTW domain-containing protein YfiP